MSQESLCNIERIIDGTDIALSLQHREGVSVMAFPSKIDEQIRRSLLFEVNYVTGGYLDNLGWDKIKTSYLEALCRQCAQCQPVISDRGDDIKIERKGFDPQVEKGHPLFFYDDLIYGINFKTVFYNDDAIEKLRVVFMDDRESIIDILKDLPVQDKRVITVNPNVIPGRLSVKELIKLILGFRPDVVVADKGAGFLNMFEVFHIIWENGIPTVMLTGEWQTDETKDVADVFITKPFNWDEIRQAMFNAIRIHGQLHR